MANGHSAQSATVNQTADELWADLCEEIGLLLSLSVHDMSAGDYLKQRKLHLDKILQIQERLDLTVKSNMNHVSV